MGKSKADPFSMAEVREVEDDSSDYDVDFDEPNSQTNPRDAKNAILKEREDKNAVREYEKAKVAPRQKPMMGSMGGDSTMNAQQSMAGEEDKRE